MNRKRRKIIKILSIILGVFLLLFIALVLFIRSPWGQNKIVNYATNYISQKTNTKVEIDKLYLTFDGNLLVKNLFLEDKKGDTLIYSRYIEANVPLWTMIRGKGYGVDALNWEGLRANIYRKDTVNGYNFQFLLDAFATQDTISEVATDTTASPVNIVIGDLHFEDVNLIFDDAVLGIDTHLMLGKLYASIEKFDLEKMTFELDEIAVANTSISYVQKPVLKKSSTESSVLPFLAFDEIDLKKVKIDYADLENGTNALLDIHHFYAEIPEINLAENSYKIEALQLENSLMSLSIKAENKSQEIDSNKVKSNAFSWPEINMEVSEVDLKNNRVTYDVGKQITTNDSLNFNHLDISKLNLKAKTFSLQDEKLEVDLEKFQFNEESGIHLKQLALNGKITDQTMRVENILFQFNNNEIKGEINAEYTKLAKLLEEPDTSKFDINLSNYQLDINDLFLFQPALENNVYVQTLSEKLVSGNLAMSGSLSSFKLKDANLFWGDSTKISAQGEIQNVTNTEKLQFSIPNFKAETNRKDVSLFLSQQDLGIELPSDISLSGNAEGALNNLSATAKLNTSQGIITLDGNFKNQTEIVYDAKVELEEIKLNKLLKNNKLGEFNATITSSGNGNNLNELNAKMDAQISSFTYNNYTFNDLGILGELKDGTGNFNTKYKDENLNMTLYASVVLDSVKPEVNANLHLIGANLQALGIVERDIRSGFDLTANFKGNSTNFDFTGKVNENVLVYNEKTYIVGDINAKAFVRADTTSVSVNNKIFDVKLESNTNPQTFGDKLQNHIMSYFNKDTTTLSTSQNSVDLKVKARIKQDPVLNDIFFIQIKNADTISLAMDFNEKSKNLQAKLKVPNIVYAGNEVDSLTVALQTNKEEFNMNLGFKEIIAGPLAIPKTVIQGNQLNDKMNLKFISYFDDEVYNLVQAEITGKRDSLRLHLLSDSLKLDKTDWKIPDDNEILYTKSKINFNDFKFSHDNQSLEITNQLPDVPKEHVAFDFENFKLSTLFSYLNPDSNLVNGELKSIRK
jgi:preprotein translocase subunit SecB